ncbi:hypothetical protein [uncultured Butyricimonas sp.]|uniref:hypothetical protein n=1 Tax=uncultured Butyricimonas sp. TaxID=1268785 RepID=UPI0026DAA3E5|nr:hypothetical protein [uncultured Butyricimonas sp.]
MELTFVDRIAIKSLIPERVNMIKGMLFRSIAQKVNFTPEEVTRHKLEEKETIFNNIPETIDVVFEESELMVMKEIIDEMDKEGTIPFGLIDSYYKIKNTNV